MVRQSHVISTTWQTLTGSDIITYSLSSAGLLISIAALIVSIRLPLYLAKRAEEHTRLEKDRDKLPHFYRKVQEFAEGFNTPGVGYQIKDVYDLSSEARELGLNTLHVNLTYLWRTIEEHDAMPHDQQGKYNKQGKYTLTPDYLALGKEVQRMIKVVHDIARHENEQLYNRN